MKQFSYDIKRGYLKNVFPTQGQAGYTLVEATFVAALFPLLMFSLISVFATANVIFQTSNVYADLNQGIMQTLRHIGREIGQSSPLVQPSHLDISTDPDGNSVIRFQIPVDWDNDGDVTSGDLNPIVEWGAYSDVGHSSNGFLGAWTRYSIINNQLVREVLDSNLIPMPKESRIVANDIQSFRATRSQNVLTLSVTALANDTIGQEGQQRPFQMTWTTQTVLRNAVN